MTETTLEQRFVGRMRELLVSLPYDLKVLFEAMTDEDLPLDARRKAVGAVIYCLSPSDPIPDSLGLVGFVDDVVVVRLVLAKMLEIGGDGVADYPERFPEQFERLSDDVALLREFFGDAISWVDRRLTMLDQAKHKGKTVATYVEDDGAGQRLYEEGLEFTTEYEIDDAVAAKLTNGAAVLEAFTKRNEIERSRQS